MNELLLDYLPLVVFIAVALGICMALMVAPFLVAYRQPDPEKLSAYECGFNAFDDARMKFDVRFYLVSISKCRSCSPGQSPSGSSVSTASGR
jgi:NADH-quinone oxidoreductase subunit A